jgi:four helix bundle protein
MGMRAKAVGELLVYQHAIAAAHAVSAILRRRGLVRDVTLRDQLGASSERVASHIAEGFGQSTDRLFAQHLHLSRASTSDVRTQLEVARARGHISPYECLGLTARYDQIARMEAGLIRSLSGENKKPRG